MKALKLNYLLYGFLLGFFFSCTGDETDLNEEERALLGKWHITSSEEVITNASGDVVEEESETFQNRDFIIEFKKDGSIQVIELDQAEWDTGTFIHDTDSDSITVSIDGRSLEGTIVDLTDTDFKVTISFTETNNDGTFTLKQTLVGIKSDGSEPGIDLEELKNKWNVLSMNMKSWIDMNRDDEFHETDELNWTIDVSDIPAHRYTVEFLEDGSLRSIDTYMEGSYDESTDWESLDLSNIGLNDSDSKTLLQVKSVTETSIVFTMVELREETFDQDGTYLIKTMGTIEVEKVTEQSASITEDVLWGNWEITDFVELQNGDDVTNPEDNPEGAVLTFNDDGTGVLTAGTNEIPIKDIKLIDGSNFTFVMEEDTGDNTVLVHIESFDDGTQTLLLSEGRIDGETDFVQYETKIKLVKQ